MCSDGLSNTLIVAEDTGWPDGQWINGRNLFDQAYAINAAPRFENDIRSHHPGGAQASPGQWLGSIPGRIDRLAGSGRVVYACRWRGDWEFLTKRNVTPF